MKYKETEIKGKNLLSEEYSVQRIYAILYKMSSDIERLDLMLRTVKKLAEEMNGNG